MQAPQRVVVPADVVVQGSLRLPLEPGTECRKARVEALGRARPRVDRSEGRMAAFAPIALILLVLIWGTGLVFGYALLEFGVRDQFQPEMEDFLEAIYVSPIANSRY